MGAPLNHPFFGNQYTNGGYITGSYTYAGDVGAMVRSVPDAATPVKYPAGQDAFRRILPKSAPSVPSMVATGMAAAVGGVVVYTYLRKLFVKTRRMESAGDKIANFGVCESCSRPLASSGPAEIKHDEHGDFVNCRECGQRNYASAASSDS